jgi:hypothetical protein
MKPTLKLHRRSCSRQRGFALVITLSLMVLLTLLAVGLLTLSAISLRSGGQGAARAEAEANARLALMLALGELQKTLGPDQGISARASAVVKDAAEPNLLGAWESWRWQPGTEGPKYSDKAARFRRWLVSTQDPATATATVATLADPVWLVKPATTGSPAGGNAAAAELRADRVLVRTGNESFGGLAWAVMDESLKAPIQLPAAEPTKDGERIARRVAPARAHPEEILPVLAPEKLRDPARILSLNTAVVAVGKPAGSGILARQADVTADSVGLLANVVDGGLKTDLTTVFESTTASPNLNGQTTLYYTAADGAPRWDYLRSHYQLNRRVTAAAGGKPQIILSANDLKPAANGVIPSSTTERLLPVIAKLQIMFSAVTHYNHIGDRVAFFNEKGIPQGNQNYGAPHLVYDPVVTLYNPYDIALDLAKLRVRIWDPPVRFGFKKNGFWLRDEFASGDFHPLARFAIAAESDVNARRYFTLLLTNLTNNKPGGRIRLEPGEVKVFSPWVEPSWTWGVETGGGYTVRCFFDWNVANDFGNRDGRTGNPMGIEAVPGWDPRAGLQTDHLSYGLKLRPQSTRYDFEIANNWAGGWLAIKNTDTFTVEAKAGRSVNLANQADFTVDLLAGATETPTSDILRTYRFRYADPAKELSANPANPVIRRTFRVGDILQKPDDKSVGGKSPFAILTMSAKTTKGEHDIAMPWLHNHPVVEGADQNTARIGNALDSYDLRFEEVSDFNQNPGGIEFDATTKRGYYGATSFSNGGVSNVPMFRVPLLPAASLGDLIPANLVVSSNLPRVTHAFGNSRAHPLIPSNSVSQAAPTGSSGRMLDHSYLLNDTLWDSTYFSTAASFTNPLVAGPKRGKVLADFFKGTAKLLNPRFIPMLQATGSADQQAERLDQLDDTKLSRQLAGSLAIQGPFNVNSDSVGAWQAMLGSLRDADLLGWTMSDLLAKDKTGFPRAGLPIAGDAENPGGKAGMDLSGQIRWAGFRALSDTQLKLLAEKIVEQIRARGVVDKAPSLSLGEFVNRRIGAAGELHTVAGLLQTALGESKLNDVFHAMDSWDLATRPVLNPKALTGVVNPAARNGQSAEGAPPILTQGDLLMALAPLITVRGDTFRIRGYGESRTKAGKITATAVCEAVVQRIPSYLDSTESPELKQADLKQPANLRFGRRLVITSFRWVPPAEI